MEIPVKPLSGKHILVTRAKHQATEMVARIEELGGKATAIPLIRMSPPQDMTALDSAIEKLEVFDWLIFTSVNGLSFFIKRLQELEVDLQRLAQLKIAAVGRKTAEAIEAYGLQGIVTPKEFRNEGVIETIQSEIQAGEKVLLPRANLAREILPYELRRLGVEVTEVDVYETILDQSSSTELIRLLQQEEIDVITFTSPSTVKSFIQAISAEIPSQLLSKIKIVCIGPVTAETAISNGLQVDGVADEYTIEGLIEVVLKI